MAGGGGGVVATPWVLKPSIHSYTHGFIWGQTLVSHVHPCLPKRRGSPEVPNLITSNSAASGLETPGQEGLKEPEPTGTG